MSRTKAEDATHTVHRLAMEQSRGDGVYFRAVRQQCGIVICEQECIGILRIGFSTGTVVTRAQIALWVINRALLLISVFSLALPRTKGTMRRNQYPLTC